MPRARPSFDAPRAGLDEITATWIGQSSWLVQIGGLNVLTDPVFSRRASPVRFIGPSRLTAPGVAIDALPPIDAVLVSHDHYDHLDEPSVRALHARFGEAIAWVTPLGYADWFARRGIRNVLELDWWQQVDLPLRGAPGRLRVSATPAQHWCRRGPKPSERLWASFAARVVYSREDDAASTVAGSGRAIWFAGDSGYRGDVFREIGARLGPFDVSFIPIGAYEPRWFMEKAHMNPEEAVQTWADLGARGVLAGMHWGTFILTDEPVLEPPARTREAWAERGLPAERLWLPAHGETLRRRPGGAT